MEKAEEIGDDLAARIGMGAPDAPTPRRPGSGTHGVSRHGPRVCITIAFAPFGRYDLITVSE